MFTSEEVKNKLKLIEQNAWKAEGNTTINGMIVWIVREMYEQVLIPQLTGLEDKNQELFDEIGFLQHDMEKLKLKEEIYASKNGGLQEPSRNAEAPVKNPRGRPKEARTSLS